MFGKVNAMKEDTLKQLWLYSCRAQNVDIDTQKLIYGAGRRISRMERQIQWRGWNEIIVCTAMITAFSWLLSAVPTPLGKTGIGILVVSSVIALFKAVHARKNWKREDVASDIKQYLTYSLDRVKQQNHFLKNVVVRYLFPFYIGSICFMFSLPMSTAIKILYSGVIGLGYFFIYRINKNAVTKRFQPLEEDLNKILEELSA